MTIQQEKVPRHFALARPTEEAHPFYREVSLIIGLGDGERERYSAEEIPDEKHPLPHAFLQFINARSMCEMLAGLDRCFDEAQNFDLFGFSVQLDNASFENVEASENMARAFQAGEKPSIYAPDDTAEAVKLWGFSSDDLDSYKARRAEWEDSIKAIPLRDVMKARRYLYTHGLLLAHIVGKTGCEGIYNPETFEPCFELINPELLPTKDESEGDEDWLSRESGGLVDSFHWQQIMDPNEYHEYLNALPSDRSNPAFLFDMNVKSAPQWAYALYAEGIFNALSSGQNIKRRLAIDENWSVELFDDGIAEPIYSMMWGYLKDGITQETGKGALAVCSYCRRIHERARSTKQYCGDSCRSMASQRKAKEKSAESER